MKHLTDDQVAEWLSGVSTEETLAHIAECPQCSEEMGALRADIARYAVARHTQAQQARTAHLTKTFSPKKTIAAHRFRWATVAALALLLAAPTAWLMKPHAASVPLPPVVATVNTSQTATTMSDDELLEAVNNDLNRDVPQALAPVSVITIARNKIAAASTGAAKNANDTVK